MNSEVAICSLALNSIGHEAITDLNGTSKAERLCNLFYAQARDHLLSLHYWNFAMTRANLAKSGTAPAFEWGSAFIIPADCLQVYQTRPERIRFENEDGHILCNQSTLSIKYIRQITDVTKFHPSFTEALHTYLSSLLVYPLTQSQSLSTKMEKKFDTIIRSAKSTDAMSAPMPNIIDDTWLDSRVNGPNEFT